MNKLLLSSALLLLLAACEKNEAVTTKPSSESAQTVAKVTEVAPTVPKSETTGHEIKEETVGNFFGVMIENSPNARPQTGLANADIVYEMEAEASITRFFALFHEEKPSKIGPVRSSRHYYLPFAETWNSPYIHFGASYMAYEKLPNLKVPTIDGIKTEGTYFERDKSRKAPHNAYLLTDKLPAFEQKPDNPHFEFGELPTSDVHVNELNVAYNGFTNVKYSYNESEKNYLRFLENVPHLDRETGAQIKVDNIIVLYAPHTDLHTGAKHIEINFEGTGEIVLYSQGKKINGTWSNISGKIQFNDSVGKALHVTEGKTWIQVVNSNKREIVTEK